MPIVAAVATDEPEVAANSAKQPMLVCSSPLGRRPNHAANARYIPSALPLLSSSPSSTNTGITVSPLSDSVPQAIDAVDSVEAPAERNPERPQH